MVSQTVRKLKETGFTSEKKPSERLRKKIMTDDNAIYKISRRKPQYSAKKIAQEINLALDNHI